MLNTSVIIAISRDIMEIVRAVMSSDLGVNRKVGTNTLTDSEIYRTLEVTATNDGDLVYDILLNNYLKYIESGRRKGAKMPPVDAIENWYKRKFGIEPDNNTLWAIRKAISRDGINPRPIMDYVFIELDKKWDKDWANELFDTIIEQIDKFFNK